MKWRLEAIAVCGVGSVILACGACGGGNAPARGPDELASADASSPSGDSGSSTDKGAALPVAMPPSATAASAPIEGPLLTDAGPPGAAASDLPPVSRSMEECATLARFPDASVAADAGAGGPKTVVPWMVDPFGDQAPKPKKGEKPAKKAPVDKGVEALRASFRKCYDAAKKTDPTQVVSLAFSHKPKGGQHLVCVTTKREAGKEDITRIMTECMLEAIKEWAAKSP